VSTVPENLPFILFAGNLVVNPTGLPMIAEFLCYKFSKTSRPDIVIYRRDIIQILRDENELLKARNKQVSQRLARQQQAFRVLNELCAKTQSYQQVNDLPQVLNELLALVLHACNIENGSLVLIDEKAGELEFVAVIGESRGYLQNHRIGIETGAVGHVIKTGVGIVIEDVHNAKHWSSIIDEVLRFHTHSLMCVPIPVRGSIIGAIEVVNQAQDDAFDENDLNILKVATRLVGLALEKVEQLTLQTEQLNETD
jgi:GAF domain-containing protein